MVDKCFFCKFEKGLINEEKILDGKLAYIIADGHPVTQYHCLIVPKRHFASFFEISQEEFLEINELIKIRKDEILKLDPTVVGFNVGINIGEAAGQTVFHLHVHLIPRRIGDVENPRGGVRGVIPEKQKY